MAENSSPGTRQTDGKNLVWFREIERKLAKLSMPAFPYRSSSSQAPGPGKQFPPVPFKTQSQSTSIEYFPDEKFPLYYQFFYGYPIFRKMIKTLTVVRF